jgi:RNA polymerase sigma-70 factor, ECF subfamily
MQSTQAGGREARFEAIYRECSWRVYAFARRRGGVEVAEEVVAETFLVAWRRIADVPEQALPWLLVVARNVLRHHARSQARAASTAQKHAWLVAASAPIADASDRLAEREELLATLAGMRDPDREALLLIAWDGLTPAEAAYVVGCAVATFHVRLHRAKRRFAAARTQTARGKAASQPHPSTGAS